MDEISVYKYTEYRRQRLLKYFLSSAIYFLFISDSLNKYYQTKAEVIDPEKFTLKNILNNKQLLTIETSFDRFFLASILTTPIFYLSIISLLNDYN